MRIGLVTIGNNPILSEYKDIIVSLLEKKNHTVSLYNEKSINERFAVNNHLIFIMDSGNLLKKSSLEKLETFLKNKGDLNVRYGSLFITDRLFPGRTFTKAMAALEESGLVLLYTDIIRNIYEMKQAAEDMNFEN
jgi:hypothetical protein